MVSQSIQRDAKETCPRRSAGIWDQWHWQSGNCPKSKEPACIGDELSGIESGEARASSVSFCNVGMARCSNCILLFRVSSCEGSSSCSWVIIRCTLIVTTGSDGGPSLVRSVSLLVWEWRRECATWWRLRADDQIARGRHDRHLRDFDVPYGLKQTELRKMAGTTRCGLDNLWLCRRHATSFCAARRRL